MTMVFSPQGFPRRAVWLLGIAFAMLMIVGGSSIYLLTQADAYAVRLYNLQNARIISGNILSDLQDAETGQRGYLLTHNISYLQPFERAATELDRSLQQLAHSPVARLPELETSFVGLQNTSHNKINELRSTIDLEADHRHADALAIVQTDRGKVYMDEARAAIGHIMSIIDQRRQKERQSLFEHGAILIVSSSVGFFCSIICAFALVIVIGRTFRLLNSAQEEMERVNHTLERRVRERTADLQLANEEVQRFAYIVSHDLRAPLVNVMGFTSELEAALATINSLLSAADQTMPGAVTTDARTAITQDLPEALNFIRTSTQRMDRLINAILKLSREGRRTLNAETIDMKSLVDSLVATVQHQIDETAARVTIRTPLPDIVSDRLALEQIFGNLIDNAVKYLDRNRSGSITISGAVNSSGVRYEIEDNGRGIDERDRERVFELFRRAGKQDRPGDGIGLAHVRALVRRLGGAIDFTSKAGEGTIFFVQLPARLSANAIRSTT